MAKIKLNAAIKKQLDIIAGQLWSNPSHACAMVGAGFSRNAKKCSSTTPTPPAWTALADEMVKKLYNPAAVNKNYLNVLDVADTYEAMFGRDQMERFLEDNIPDEMLEPGELHEKFLRLPWRDVYTTNYDTLLERTSDKIDGKYTFINKQEEIANSNSPRIIKLHGSFSIGKDYVFTNEDYRKYPEKNQVFVNTVKQSLTENVFCLFGFSGEDPNFQNWLGWLKDHFELTTPKVYLIGYLNFDESKFKLLESRKITPIDLAQVCNSTADTGDALRSVVEYLHGRNPYNSEWDINQLTDEKLSLAKLKKINAEYPGWIIAPHSERDQLVQSLYYADNNLISRLRQKTTDIKLAYYINGFYEKAAFPLLDDYVIFFEKIVQEYEALKTTKEITKWRVLVLALMRAYRERGNGAKWGEYKDLFERHIKGVDLNLKSRYYYELCMFDVVALNFKELHAHISEWGKNAMPEIWRAKRASLIAEFFDIKEARAELENALQSFTKRINNISKSTDYSVLAQKALILFLLGRVKGAEKLIAWKIPSKEDTYREELQMLRQSKCDPTEEFAYFEYSLRPFEPRGNREEKASFDINRISQTYHWDHERRDIRMAMQCMRMMEEYASPIIAQRMLVLDKKAQAILINNLSYAYPNMALMHIIRTGDKDNVDALFSRKSLSKMTRSQADEVLGIYVDLFKEIVTNETRKIGLQTDAITAVLPEIASRLVTKASFEIKNELLEQIGKYYSSTYKGRVIGISVLVKRLMATFCKKEQNELLSQLVAMPFPNHYPHYEKVWLFEPMHYLDLDEAKGIRINKRQVSKLIQKLKSEDDERIVAFCRLENMCQLGMLDESQKIAFGEGIWYKIDEKTGFPASLPYYRFVYLRLPCPAKINVVKLMHQYIAETPFCKDEKMGVAMVRGEFDYWNTILGAASLDFAWNRKEIQRLTENILAWWNQNKKCLCHKQEQFLMHSPQEEYEYRFLKIIGIVSKVVIPNLRYLNTEQKQKLEQLASESLSYTHHGLSMQAVVLKKSILKQEYAQYISENIVSPIEDDIIKACVAIQYLAVRGIFEKTMVNSITRFFRYGKREGLNTVLVTICQMMDGGWQPTKEQLSDLCMGLRTQLKQTGADEKDSDLYVEEKIYLRQKCVELASALQRKAAPLDELLSTIVSQWLTIAEDENEFCEIRKAIE